MNYTAAQIAAFAASFLAGNLAGIPADAFPAVAAHVKAENEALKATKAKNSPRPSFKVSEKGAVSVYGLGRFPVTLYREQWEKLFAMRTEVETFIAENAANLSKKGDAKPETATPANPA